MLLISRVPFEVVQTFALGLNIRTSEAIYNISFLYAQFQVNEILIAGENVTNNVNIFQTWELICRIYFL